MDKDKIEAARKRLKEHPGGENLKMITDSNRARELQKKGVEARRRNTERRELLKQVIEDMKKMNTEVTGDSPPALEILKMCMLEAVRNEDFSLAAQYAKEIAPYENPKLASTSMDVTKRDLSDLSDEEFQEELKKLQEEDQ